MNRHSWARGPYSRDRRAVWQDQRNSWQYDCHRGLRGPWGGLGDLLSQHVPALLEVRPELVAKHEIAILAAAPELVSLVGPVKASLMETASENGRFRFYVASYAQRINHGLAEFIMAWADHQAEPPIVCFDNVDKADPTTLGALQVLLRRADPRRLPLWVGTSDDLPIEMAVHVERYDVQATTAPELRSQLARTSLPVPWREWLCRTASWRGEWEPLAVLRPAVPPPDLLDLQAGLDQLCADKATRIILARQFVNSDGTGDEPAPLRAYQMSEGTDTAQWHDQRRAEIKSRYPHWARLAATAFHAERGTCPRDYGIHALTAAVQHGMAHAAYHGAVEFAERGRSLTRLPEDIDHWREFTRMKGNALALLNAPDDAAALYEEIRATDSRPRSQLMAAYGTAMLLTKHLPKSRLDHQKAWDWLEKALAATDELPDTADRAFSKALVLNGLGLTAANMGDFRAALDQLEQAMKLIEQGPPDGAHELLRVVLHINQNYTYAALHDWQGAIGALRKALARDPNHVDYHVELGGIYQRLGQFRDALACYDAAARIGPPFPELYYNRAITHMKSGSTQDAITDLDYVLELDPDYLDAIINRASIREQSGASVEAMGDIRHGLEISPGNPHLTCIRGLVELELGEPGAEQSLTAALNADPRLAEAWANRAVIRFGRGDNDAAIDDLHHALRLTDDPLIRLNLGLALQAAGKTAQAISEFTRSLGHPDVDPDTEAELHFLRGSAHLVAGAPAAAAEDFRRHLTYGPSTHHDELAAWVPELLEADS